MGLPGIQGPMGKTGEPVSLVFFYQSSTLKPFSCI